jgi:L,D-peptidoglycan transpeptidase YkuD (ErfK/YbiS/YcfS/YnhG family)
MNKQNIIHVRSDHQLHWQGKTFPCALGKGGIRTDKSEGDGVTPTGTFALRRVLYRSDRLSEPQTCLKVEEITKTQGWCDDPTHEMYNQAVELPFAGSHEELWRDDHIYDIIVVLGHNDNPPVAGLGSAIFFHLARTAFQPTQGCVAVTLQTMLEILKTIEPDVQMEISL